MISKTRLVHDFYYERQDYSLMDFRESSMDSQHIEVELGEDFTWPQHINAFLNFLTQIGFVISDKSKEKVLDVCHNCIEPIEEEKCETE